MRREGAMNFEPITKTIDDPNAPIRMRGRSITIKLTEGRITFEANVPDDMTEDEQTYLSEMIDAYVADLRSKFPFVGDKVSERVGRPEDN